MPSVLPLNAEEASLEVISQAAQIVAWASGDHLIGDEWAVWRAEILGPAANRHPAREQALLKGQLHRGQPAAALPDPAAHELACAWAHYYTLLVQASERTNPYWLSRWPENRLLLLADWSQADARAQQTLAQRADRRRLADLPIPRTLVLLVLDHLMRWLAIGLYVSLASGELSALFSESIGHVSIDIQGERNQITGMPFFAGLVYVLLNVAIIPLAVLGLASRWKQRQERRLNRLCVEHGIPYSRLRQRTTPAQVGLVVLLGVVYALMGQYYGLPAQVVLAFVAYFPYLLVLYGQYSVGWLSSVQFRRLLAANEPPKSSWSADENDEAILGLEARLKAMNRRLESYVLESALFGALALSGFLQIIAEELISFQDVGQFTRQFSLALGHYFHFEGTAGWAVLVQLFSDQRSLFCLLCYESLFCAVAFLVVIASRLRFSDLADAIEQHLEVAHAFNDKEEQLGPAPPDHLGGENRRTWLNAKIRDQLAEAQAGFAQTDGPVAFTRYFRNLGVSAYFAMLVTAGFFLTPAVAVFFFGLWLLSQGFFALRQGRRSLLDFKFRAQELLLVHRWRINGLTVVLFVLGTVATAEGANQIGNWLWAGGCVLLVAAAAGRCLLLPAPFGSDDERTCRQLRLGHRLLLVFMHVLGVLTLALVGPPKPLLSESAASPFVAGFLIGLLGEQAVDSLLSPRWQSLRFWGRVR